MKNIKKIDIHAHVNPFSKYSPVYRENGCPMVSTEELISFYDRLNIEKGVLLPIVAPEAAIMQLTPEMNKWVADLHPDRFLWFCNVDPRALDNEAQGDLEYLVAHYKSLGALGIGEVTSNLETDDPMLDNLFSVAERLDMPVTIHIAPKRGGCYGIIDGVGLEKLEGVLKKHPDLKIFGHSQPFWSEIGENNEEIRNTYPTGKIKEGRVAKLLREYPNLYCDISAGSGANAMMRDPEYTARFVEEFSDRILYGCDICARVATFPFAFDEYLDKMVEDGMISEENYRKIVRDNAKRLLRI